MGAQVGSCLLEIEAALGADGLPAANHLEVAQADLACGSISRGQRAASSPGSPALAGGSLAHHRETGRYGQEVHRLQQPERAAERMRAFVAEQHADLVKNFDPKVVRLRKKLKVMVHPDALRDLGEDGTP